MLSALGWISHDDEHSLHAKSVARAQDVVSVFRLEDALNQARKTHRAVTKHALDSA